MTTFYLVILIRNILNNLSGFLIKKQAEL